jgi:magnesium transporter
MITVRHVLNGAVLTVAVEQAPQLAADGQGVLWIDLVGDDARTPELMERLGVDEFLVEDMLEAATHPKAEARHDHLLLVVNGLDVDLEADRFQLETMELDIVVGRTWVVTHADEQLDVTMRAARLVDRDPSQAGSPAEMAHLLLDAMVDEYEPFIDHFIPERVEAIEEALFDGKADPDVRREIHLRRRDVQRLQRTATPQAEAVRRAATMSTALAPNQQHLFTDIADRLTRVAAQTESLRTQLDTAFAQYQTLVANTQNEIMKVLTMVSATLLPITVVAGIYGMNFEFMPELHERWGYPAVMALNAVIVLSALAFFHWKGWIGRRREREGRRLGGSLDLGFGRILRTPAMGARAVSRTAGRLVRRGDSR